jgi:ABC-2 type transport system permease protein
MTTGTMTTSTLTAADKAADRNRRAGTVVLDRYGFGGLVRSELTKLRTVRSTAWTLGLTVALGIGLSALAAVETRLHWSSMSVADRFTFDPTRLSLIGIFFAQLTIGVLGILVISAEYGTGTIRATLAAAPRRPGVLAAKALVLAAVALVVSESSAFIAYFVGQALLSAPAVHTTIASPGALRAVAGSGIYLCALGLFALGLATVVRHTAGAISAFIGVLFVLPLVTEALPTSLATPIGRFLPAHIGQSIVSLHGEGASFAPWPSLLLMCAYAGAALLVGGALLVRRDA